MSAPKRKPGDWLAAAQARAARDPSAFLVAAPPLFERKGAKGSGDDVRDLADAQPVATGYCKWDGCAEYEYHRGHHCGPDDLRGYLAALQRVYVECARLTAGDALAECEQIGWANSEETKR